MPTGKRERSRKCNQGKAGLGHGSDSQRTVSHHSLPFSKVSERGYRREKVVHALVRDEVSEVADLWGKNISSGGLVA